MNKLMRRAIGAGFLVASALAQASVLTYLQDPTQAMETPGSQSFSFAADAGPGQVSFQVQGYATLDGDNGWIDLLHVSLNGSEIFLGTYDLGGGGNNRTLASPASSLVVVNTPSRQVNITLPLSLIAGTNTLEVSYTSPTSFEGSNRAGFQGLGDEGWGLNALRVTDAGTVPEPAMLPLLALGLLSASRVARRRRR